MLRELSVLAIVSVQKCYNAPICGLFAKSANLIFKFLSLKISLIQADCHWKQVLVVHSTRFHGLEQSLEILPERDSDLLASLDKGIVHCRSQCTLNTTEEQRALSIYQTPHIGLTMTEVGLESLPCLIYVYVGTRRPRLDPSCRHSQAHPSTSLLLTWMLAEVGLQHHLSLHL